MKYLFANRATSRLKTPVVAASATIMLPMGDGARFPSPTVDDFFLVTLADRRTGQFEICKCTSRSGDILNVLRGQEGTAPQDFQAGAVCSNRVTAGTISEFQDQALETPGYTKAEADERFALVEGDDMTGPLAGVDPTGPADLTRKDYVDERLDLKSDKGHKHPIHEVIDLPLALENRVPEAPDDGVTYIRRNLDWWPGGSVGGGGATISEEPPLDPKLEDLWYNNTTGQTFIYYNTWVQIAGPLTETHAEGDLLLIDFINQIIFVNGIEVDWADRATVYTGGTVDANGWYSHEPGGSPGSRESGRLTEDIWPLFMHADGRTLVVEYSQSAAHGSPDFYEVEFAVYGENYMYFENGLNGMEFYDGYGPDSLTVGHNNAGISRFGVSCNNTSYYGSQNGSPAVAGTIGSPAPFAPANEVDEVVWGTIRHTSGGGSELSDDAGVAGPRIRSIRLKTYSPPEDLPAITSLAVLSIDFINSMASFDNKRVAWEDLGTLFSGGVIDAGGWYSSSSGLSAQITELAGTAFTNDDGLTIIIEYDTPAPYASSGFYGELHWLGSNDLDMGNDNRGAWAGDSNGPSVISAGTDAIGINRMAMSANATSYYISQSGSAVSAPGIMGEPPSFSTPPPDDPYTPTIWFWTGVNFGIGGSTPTSSGVRMRSLQVLPYMPPEYLPALSTVGV